MRLRPAAQRVLTFAGPAALLAFFFRDSLGSDTFLARRDAFRLHLPLRQFVQRELAAHRLPTWYPDDGLGVSAIGTLHTGLFHPITWLTLALRADQGIKWQALSAYPIAFAGAYLLARQLHAPRAGRFLAGLTYSLSGYLISMSDNPLFSQAAALLPWAAFVAEVLGRRPSVRAGAGLALVLALTLWVGDVQALLLQVVVATAVLCSHFVIELRDPPGSLARWRRRAVAELVSGVLFLLLAAPVLSAAWAVFRESARSTGISPDLALVWPLDPLRLLEIPLGSFVPSEMLQGGWDVPVRYLSGYHGTLWSLSEQVGVVAVACAVLALVALRPERRARAIYGGAAVLGLLLALGRRGGLYLLLYRYAPLGAAFRYPEKMMPLALLGLSVLAGWGVRALRRHHVRVAGGLAMAGALLLAVWALCSPERVAEVLQWSDPAHAAVDPDVTAAVIDGLRSRLGLSGLLLLALAGLSLWRRRGEWGAVALQYAQAVLVGASAFAAGPISLLATPSPLAPAIERLRLGPTPRLCWDVSSYHYDHAPDDPSLGSLIANLRALAPNLGSRLGVGISEGYLPGLPGSLEDLCYRTRSCGTDCSRVEGVRYGIVSAERFSELEKSRPELRRIQTFEDPALVLFEDPGARGFAALPALHFEPTEAAARQALDDNRVDLRNQVVVVGSGPDVPAPAGRVDATRPTPESIAADVDLPAPASVVVSENCAPGWRALVDGAPARLDRANLALCRVDCPAGKHHLELDYVPPGWPLALWAYAAGLLGLLVALRVKE